MVLFYQINEFSLTFKYLRLGGKPYIVASSVEPTLRNQAIHHAGNFYS